MAGLVGLRRLGSGRGLDNLGQLHDDLGVKGSGYFGPQRSSEGYSTEISAADDKGGYPLMVPTLNRAEMSRMLAGNDPTPEIHEKAASWAAFRRGRGESPFASRQGLWMAMPQE